MFFVPVGKDSLTNSGKSANRFKNSKLPDKLGDFTYSSQMILEPKTGQAANAIQTIKYSELSSMRPPSGHTAFIMG